LWGNGECSFEVGAIPAGAAPVSGVLADVDRDGDIDAVVLGDDPRWQGSLLVLENLGQRMFRLRSGGNGQIPAAVRLAVADFDADGQLDAAVTSVEDRAVYVFYGSGAYSFGDPVRLDVPGSDFVLPVPVAAGDLDGDAFVDLIVGNGLVDASPWFPPEWFSHQASERTGSGSATLGIGFATLFPGAAGRAFGKGIPLPADNLPRDLAIRDLNGNGRQEVMVAGAGLLIISSPGMAGQRIETFVPALGASLTTGDFDGDGNMDVAMVGESRSVDYFLNLGHNGDAPFAELRTTSGPGLLAPTEVLAIDVNGDSIVDLVTATVTRFESFIGMGDGGFAEPIVSRIGSFITRLKPIHDGQGRTSIAAVVRSGLALQVFRIHRDGSISAGDVVDDQADHGRLITPDLNGDGRSDIVVFARTGRRHGIVVYLQEPDGTFRQLEHREVLLSLTPLSSGDLNGDGAPDVVVMHKGRSVSILLNDGAGQLLAPQEVVTNGPHGAALGDVDGDGVLDLAVSMSASGNGAFGPFVLKGNGDGSFGSAVHLIPEHRGLQTEGAFVGVVNVADVDNDGRNEVLVSTPYGVSILGLLPDGSVRSPVTFALPNPSYRPLTVADVNGDGLIDVITPSRGANPISEADDSFVRVGMLLNRTIVGTRRPGDTDCNGQVETDDVEELMRMIFAKWHGLACRGAADVNADSVVTAADIAALEKLVGAEATGNSY